MNHFDFSIDLDSDPKKVTILNLIKPKFDEQEKRIEALQTQIDALKKEPQLNFKVGWVYETNDGSKDYLITSIDEDKRVRATNLASGLGVCFSMWGTYHAQGVELELICSTGRKWEPEE